jgi:hypothetical protein
MKDKKKIIQTIFSSSLGLLATVIVHLVSWLVSGLLIAALALLIGGALFKIMGAEMQPLLDTSFYLALVLWPITLIALLVGAAVTAEIIIKMAWLPVGLMVLLGLAVGGAIGYFYQRPFLQKRPYLTASLLGLFFNLLAMIILAAVQSSTFLILLPGYLCLGPAVGIVAVYFIRLALPVPIEEAFLKEKYVSAAE